MKLNLLLATALLLTGLMMTSCGGDDDLASTSFDYDFNTATPYVGTHSDDLTAEMTVTELESGNTMINVELTNTVDGVTYNIHAHDAADASSTPNGTPYNESPNSAVFAQQLVGNGGTASISQETTLDYTAVTTTYDGFFVVHDPLQDISTVDLSTYLIVGAFAR